MKIKHDRQNYRKHSDKNKAMIRRSLEECGAGRSILIDNQNTAVAGNGVLEQAEKLGIPIRVIESDGSELIAVKRTDLSPDDPKRKELALADNATSDASEWDFDAIQDDKWDTSDLLDWGIDIEEPESREEAQKSIYSEEIKPFDRVYALLMCDSSEAAKIALALSEIEKKFPEISITTSGV